MFNKKYVLKKNKFAPPLIFTLLWIHHLSRRKHNLFMIYKLAFKVNYQSVWYKNV